MSRKKWLRVFRLATFLVILSCIGLIIYTAVSSRQNTVPNETFVANIQPSPDVIIYTAEPSPSPVPTPTPAPPFEEYDISLMALGDNLLHMGIVYTGKMSDGSYDYSFLFESITPFLEEAELKIINQETILGGNDFGFSGYPAFNSPTQVGDAIAAAGFNVVLHASNHTTDKGVAGIENCLSFWEQYPEILISGISSPENASDIPLITIDDFTFAVLNYTYGPNHTVLKEEYHNRLKMLCNYDSQTGTIDFTTLNPQVIEDIKTAKTLADIVIVCPHWGTEYQTSPSKYQRNFATEIANAGADVIIGTHPHVPQPVEWIISEDGHRTLCYYSLGNYVSTQKQAICMLEAMAWVTFHVTEQGITLSETNTGVIPLICHYKSNPVRLETVYLLEDYTEELALKHGIWQYGEVELHLDFLQSESKQIFGDMLMRSSEILP